MGCCQPTESIPYDYSSESTVKPFNLSSSRILCNNKNNYITSLRVTHQNLFPNNHKSPKKEMIHRVFQTPKQKKSKVLNWNPSKTNFKIILAAYQNEELKLLFDYIINEQSFEKDWLFIEHKWASYPQNLGGLACVFIVNILTSYLNEEINRDLLKETEDVLTMLINDNKLIRILEYFLEKNLDQNFTQREQEFLMISLILEFRISFNEIFFKIILKLLIKYIIAFNIESKNQKIETVLIIFDILRKVHEKSDLIPFLFMENGLIISRTIWFVYAISLEIYSFEDQLIIWFRILNFIDEISTKKDLRLYDVILMFKQCNLKDILFKMQEKINFGIQKIDKSNDNIKLFERNLLKYIGFLTLGILF